jgi:O-antigen/teichoic acid export membrane protein
MNYMKLKSLMVARYQNSVIRRSTILLGLVIPAFGANFFTYYFADKLLAPESFGLFYVATTVSNVLFSGSLILNLFVTRYLVSAVRTTGELSAFAAIRKMENTVIIWGTLCAAIIFLILLVIGKQIGTQSWFIIMLVVLDAFTAYIVDLGRALLQSLRKTVALGLYTLVWMVLRFLLCLLGILAFNTVWGALLGIVVSAIIIFVGFHIWIARSTGSVQTTAPSLPSPIALVPAILSYGLLIAVSNLDVMLRRYAELFFPDGKQPCCLFGVVDISQSDIGRYDVIVANVVPDDDRASRRPRNPHYRN